MPKTGLFRARNSFSDFAQASIISDGQTSYFEPIHIKVFRQATPIFYHFKMREFFGLERGMCASARSNQSIYCLPSYFELAGLD